MKINKKLYLAFAAAIACSAYAQPAKNLNNGFYRVQNYKSSRYAYVYDNTGWIKITDYSADMGAVALFAPQVKDRLSDPASICYVQKMSNKHDVIGQNTSLFGIIGHYVQIQDATTSKGVAAKRITPLYSGTNFFLYDASSSSYYDTAGSSSEVKAQNNPTFTDTYYWQFIPFTPEGDEYLGIAPNEAMKVGDKYYKPYVIGFDMTFLSPGMKAYYVKEVKNDAIIFAEIKGTIPANTPIIIECSAAEASNNRVNVSIDRSAAITGNKLTAQYFCYANHGESAYKVYDSSTMRVLMVKDGKLTYGKAASDDDIHTAQLMFKDGVTRTYKHCLNGNESYLSVPAATPDNLVAMTEREYAVSHNLLGDADNNGIVNKNDISTLVQMTMRQKAENLMADMNNDGRITITDVALLIAKLKI